MCLARVNPVTLAVGNTVKRVVIIAAAMLVLGEAMEPVAMVCLLYTSPSPRDRTRSRMPSSA